MRSAFIKAANDIQEGCFHFAVLVSVVSFTAMIRVNDLINSLGKKD